MNLRTVEACPICGANQFEPFLKVKDYTVSQAFFTIVRCGSCGFHFTNPVPPEAEIGNYYKSDSYISHSSTKRGLINKLYHLVRKRALKKKVGLINGLTKGRNLLDIGAGTGHFLAAANTNGWFGKGLEPDADARNLAKSLNQVDLDPLEKLNSLEPGSFSVVTMWHVLEHVYHLQRDLNVISGLLEKNGYLVVAVPNMDSYDAKYYGEYWAAYDVPIHLYHFKESDLVRLMAMHQLKLEKVLPMKYDAYYVSMLSEKYKSGGGVLKGFWRGFISNMKAKNCNYSSKIYIFKRNF